MKSLRDSVSKGYKGVAHMKKDTDLDPLRRRDVFKNSSRNWRGKGNWPAADVGPLSREKASPTYTRLPKGHDGQSESGASPESAGSTGYARHRGITGDHGQYVWSLLAAV
jgi:hypothetical protein